MYRRLIIDTAERSSVFEGKCTTVYYEEHPAIIHRNRKKREANGDNEIQ
jgi:hypothetical protein